MEMMVIIRKNSLALNLNQIYILYYSDVGYEKLLYFILKQKGWIAYII